MWKSVIIVFIVIYAAGGAKKDALKQFSQGSKKFAVATYKQISEDKPGDNFVACPFSAEVILSLAQNGARGDTGREIRNSLFLPNSKGKISSMFQKVMKSVQSDDDFTIQSANKIYIQAHIPIKRKFANISKEIYKASVENIDFAQSSQAAETINKWIAEQTQNNIQNLVSEDNFTPLTVALLVNALYFQASWKNIFKKRLTAEKEFHTSAENAIQVAMMHKHDYLEYAESEDLGAKLLKMPFRTDRNVNMVFVLPDEIEGLGKLEKNFEKVFSGVDFKEEHVEVFLPKFKIETSIKLKEILQKLGVEKAFEKADFSGMAGEKGELFISEVIQKNYISVQEDGVEAASATAINFQGRSLMKFVDEKKTFVADHPFLFYIAIDDIIVFTGRVISPSG